MPAPDKMERSARILLSPASSSSSYTSQSIPEEQSLKHVLRTLRKRKIWIASFVLGGIVLAVLACLLLTRQYRSTATVQVGKDLTVQVDLSNEAPGPTLSQSDTKTDIATHIAVLDDNNTALAVIRDLDLEKFRPFAFHPGLLGSLTGKNARIEREMNLPLERAPLRRGRLLKLFAKKLQVKNPPDTRLISVTFTNPNPELAAKIANDVVREYVQFEARDTIDGAGVQLLLPQLNTLRQQMDDAQQKLADFERQTGLNGLILKSMGEGSGGGALTHIPTLDRLDELNQALTAAEANRIGKEAIYNLTRTHNARLVAGLAASNIPAIATSSVVTQGNGLELLQNLRQQQAALEVQYSADASKYGARNPVMLELHNQLATLNQQIRDELEQIDLRARNDYLVARGNEDELRTAFKQQQAEASALNQNAVNLQLLSERASSTRQLFESLNRQIQDAQVQAGLRSTNIRVTDPARPNGSPWIPNPPLYVAIGMVVGLLLGVASAFVLEHMDDTVKTSVEVQPLTRLPVLASIPLLKGKKQKQLTDGEAGVRTDGKDFSPLLSRPRSAAAEAYRSLRNAVLQNRKFEGSVSLLVTSPLAGEGKTSVCYNLGIAIAHAGERVLLIDADLHHPRLHAFFGMPQAPGLSEVLEEEETSLSWIQKHPAVSNLSLLPAGSKVNHPSELLNSVKFDHLLQALKDQYSVILLDSPPVLLLADAVVLTAKADAVLGVVRAEVTNETAVTRVTKILERYGDRSLGLVLNGVDTSSIDYFYAYGHNLSEKYFEEA